MFKKLTLGLLVACTTGFSMSYSQSDNQVVEERPSLGFYFDYGPIDSYKVEYKEQISNFTNPDDVGTIYESTGLYVSPTVGFAGHIPFLWNKYLDATATVGFNEWVITAKTYQDANSEGMAIPAEKRDQSFKTFNVIIEGGPELGFPIYEDYETQQLVKPFVQVRGMFIKTFNTTSDSHWKSDQAFGYAFVGGLRYSYDYISFGVGVRKEHVSWEPLYDPAEGPQDKNELKVEYDRDFKPWVAVEFSFY